MASHDVSGFATARQSPDYLAAMDAPDPAPPRTTLIVIASALGVGLGVVGLGLAIESSPVSLIGGVVAGLAVIVFIMTAGERARAALPVHRELAMIVAITHEQRAINPFEGSRSSKIKVDHVELHFEDGSANKREVCVASLRQKIRSGTLALPCMGVAACRGDELHAWYPIPPS